MLWGSGISRAIYATFAPSESHFRVHRTGSPAVSSGRGSLGRSRGTKGIGGQTALLPGSGTCCRIATYRGVSVSEQRSRAAGRAIHDSCSGEVADKLWKSRCGGETDFFPVLGRLEDCLVWFCCSPGSAHADCDFHYDTWDKIGSLLPQSPSFSRNEYVVEVELSCRKRDFALSCPYSSAPHFFNPPSYTPPPPLEFTKNLLPEGATAHKSNSGR